MCKINIENHYVRRPVDFKSVYQLNPTLFDLLIDFKSQLTVRITFFLFIFTGQYGWRCLVCPSDDQKWYVLEIKRGRLRIECQPEPSVWRTSPPPRHDQSFRTSCEIKCQISRRLNFSFTRERKLYRKHYCKLMLHCDSAS